MYRALAWKALHDGVDLDDEAAVAALGERAALRRRGRRVSRRRPRRRPAASARRRSTRPRPPWRGIPAVRAVLVARQRALGERGGVVMEGRDIGTVVFPDGRREDLSRRVAGRAGAPPRRRSGHTSSARARSRPAVATALAERDKSDSTRAASPLAVAPDAVLIDTTGMPIADVVQRVLTRCGR